MSVSENLGQILHEIGDAKLVCVTKTVDSERINEAIRAGAFIIGENRIQEYEEKYENILPCEKHFIGHLQKNKVRQAVYHFDLIQSVDSIKVAEEIDKRAKDIDKVQHVLLQINIGEESQKFGFLLNELVKTLKDIRILENIMVDGFMCIPPYVPPEQARPYFTKMKTLFDDIKREYSSGKHGNIDMKELSMGMSGDYMVAIEEGATMVRIGSAIFGDRK